MDVGTGLGALGEKGAPMNDDRAALFIERDRVRVSRGTPEALR